MAFLRVAVVRLRPSTILTILRYQEMCVPSVIKISPWLLKLRTDGQTVTLISTRLFILIIYVCICNTIIITQRLPSSRATDVRGAIRIRAELAKSEKAREFFKR